LARCAIDLARAAECQESEARVAAVVPPDPHIVDLNADAREVLA
jgi:hypothetical protein